MIIAKVGRRGQLTLPSEVRRQANLKEGDQVAFVVEAGHVILRPLTQTLLDLRGSVAVTAPQDFAAVRQRVLAARTVQRAGDGD